AGPVVYPSLYLFQLFAAKVMRGKARPEALRPVEPRSGQREKLAQPSAQSRKIPAPANIGKQTDPRLGHGQARVLGRDAELRRLRDTDAPTHGDSVHEGDHRLGIGEEQVIEPVF